MAKLKVAVIFGGKSTEHEVSIQSARNVVRALDRSLYEPVLIGIEKSGRWTMGRESRLLLSEGNPHLALLDSAEPEIALKAGAGASDVIALESGQSLTSVDVVFPVLHGGFGEDGSVQGLLKLAGIPFVGPSILASALAMDKDASKRLLRDAGIPVAPWICIAKGGPLPSPDEVGRLLGYPCFVKPANAGSSVGVSKVTNADELPQALREAFRFDRKLLIEKAIVGREIEVAVLGNKTARASLAGEIQANAEFYSYQAKYIDENGAVLTIPAQLSDAEMKKVQDLALRAFSCLDCEGMARVDFFLSTEGEFIVNELNTIPGFTAISMYPKLWEASGLSYSGLITALIELAIERKAEEDELETSIEP